MLLDSTAGGGRPALRFFSGEHTVFRFSERLFDLVLLSAVWAMLCIPVITIGPATTALYYAVVKSVRHHEPGALRSFFVSFRQNFRVGLVTGLIVTLCGLALFFSLDVLELMARAGDRAGVILYYAGSVFGVFLLGLSCWLFPILSRFTMDLRGLFVAAAQLGVRHLPSTGVVALLVLEAAEFTGAHVYPILIVPGLTALLASLFYERVFQKYTPDVPEDEGEERPWYLP